MKKHFVFATVALLTALNHIAVHAQSDAGRETQAVVRLKATIDIRKTGDPDFDPLPLIRSRESSLNPTHKLLLLPRGKTWQLLEINTGEIRKSFERFDGLPVLSPGAQWILTLKRKNSAEVWSVQTGQKQCEVNGLPGERFDVKWSSDESSLMFLTRHEGFRASLLDKEKTKAHIFTTANCQLRFTLSMKTAYFAEAMFSPNSQSILTTSSKEEPKLWDLQTGKLKATLSPPENTIFRASSGMFSPDGRFILVMGYYVGTTLWDASTGEFLRQLTGSSFGSHDYAVRGFSPDGRLLVVYHEHLKSILKVESSIELIDIETGQKTAVLRGTNMMASTHQVEWSPDGTTLVTAGGNREYNGKIWEVKNGRLIATFPMIAKMSRIPFDVGYKNLDHISFHPSLPVITVSNNNYTRLLNPANGELLQMLDNDIAPAKWTTDGCLLITTSKDGKELKIWELIKSDLNVASSN